MRLRHVLISCFCLVLSACTGWTVQPVTYAAPTPQPSRTPSIRTATPLISFPTASSSPTETATLLTPSLTPTATLLELTASPSETATPTPTLTMTPEPLSVRILGCDTSVDLTHGMGEVTNAYIIIRNPTPSDEAGICATLSGLDEGRLHPDKTRCVASLPSGYQVALKLTVDTTFKAQTPIQVDLTISGSLLLRVGEPACTDVGLFRPADEDLGVPKPIP